MNVSKPGTQRRRPARFAFFLLMLLCAAAAAGGLVMTLWNAVLVPALGAHALSYWQALGLLLLCRVLFGNWGPRRMGPHGAHGGPGDRSGSLSPEQRARLRAHWKSRCAPGDAEAAATHGTEVTATAGKSV